VRLADFGGRMHFIHFDTSHVEGAVRMMQVRGDWVAAAALNRQRLGGCCK
jgi:hypothetical protein